MAVTMPVLFVPPRRILDRDDEDATAVELTTVEALNVQLDPMGVGGVCGKDVPDDPFADGKQDVCRHGAEFGVEEPLELLVRRIWRGPIPWMTAGMEVRDEAVGQGRAVRPVGEEASRLEDVEDLLAGRRSRERDAGPRAPVDAGMIADDVKVRVRVAVAQDRPVAPRTRVGTRRAHPERVAHFVRDVLHACA